MTAGRDRMRRSPSRRIADCHPADDGGTIRAPMVPRRNRARRAAAIAAAAALLAPVGAAAQPASEPDRLASVNLGMQFVYDAFMNRVTFRQHGETGSFNAHYDVSKHHALDGGVAVRVWKALAVGVAVSHVAEPMTVLIRAEVPHPFFFDFPREASGVRRGLDRREIGLHLQGQYWRSHTENLLLRATWGPTVFIVRQDLVSEIGTRESLDFDQAALASHRATTVTAGSFGFHLGFDGVFFVTDRVGLGFNVRYSRGTASVRLDDRFPTPLELGGTHAGGGLRFAF